MKLSNKLLFLFVIPICLSWANWPILPQNGVSFQLKGKKYQLSAKMRLATGGFGQRGGLARAYVDTVSNCFYINGNFIEILRQDHPMQPQCGIALGFEFHPDVDSFPYLPTRATVQFRDFRWGGVEFDAADTLNYTGVTNSVSDDIYFEVLSFRNDTVEGRFSGILLSGAGGMAQLDSGYFKARVYRRKSR